MLTILTSRSVAEMLGAMWFSNAFKGNIQVGPNTFGPTWIVPACFIQTSVASKEKSWKRPVCIKANQWEPLCLCLPQLSSLSLLDHSLLFIFPWTVWSAFVTCDVSLLVICSLFKGNYELWIILAAFLRANTDRNYIRSNDVYMDSYWASCNLFSKFDLPWVISFYVWWSEEMTRMKKETVVKLFNP